MRLLQPAAAVARTASDASPLDTTAPPAPAPAPAPVPPSAMASKSTHSRAANEKCVTEEIPLVRPSVLMTLPPPNEDQIQRVGVAAVVAGSAKRVTMTSAMDGFGKEADGGITMFEGKSMAQVAGVGVGVSVGDTFVVVASSHQPAGGVALVVAASAHSARSDTEAVAVYIYPDRRVLAGTRREGGVFVIVLAEEKALFSQPFLTAGVVKTTTCPPPPPSRHKQRRPSERPCNAITLWYN